MMGYPSSSVVENRLPKQETQVLSLGQEDPLEKEMVTHSSILAWEVPRTKEPGRPQSMRCKGCIWRARVFSELLYLNLYRNKNTGVRGWEWQGHVSETGPCNVFVVWSTLTLRPTRGWLPDVLLPSPPTVGWFPDTLKHQYMGTRLFTSQSFEDWKEFLKSLF